MTKSFTINHFSLKI